MSDSTESAPSIGLPWVSRAGSIFAKMSGALLPPSIRLVGAGIQLLSTILIARALGDEGSAMFFYWSAVLMSCVPVATYGLEQIALRNAPRMEKHGPDEVMKYLASLRTFATGVALTIGIVLILYAVFAHDASSKLEFWPFLLPVALAAMTINMINGESLKGLSRPVLGVIAGHFIPVTLFCASCALFARHLDSRGLLIIYTGSYLVAALAVQFGPVLEFRKLFVLPRSNEIRQLFREGFSVCCVNLFGAASYVLPLTILEMMRPPEEVAYVTTSFRISILFAVLSAAVHSVFAPDLSRAATLDRPGYALFRVYGKAIAISLGALLIPLMVGIFFPETVMGVFGESFKNGADTLRLLLLAQLAFLCLGPVPYLLLMTEQTVLLARLGFAKLALTIALAFYFIPNNGGIGMVLALSIAYLLEEIAGILLAIRGIRKKSARPAES